MSTRRLRPSPFTAPIAVRRLADRPVDGVLQQLLDLLAHRAQVSPADRVDECAHLGGVLRRRHAPLLAGLAAAPAPSRSARSSVGEDPRRARPRARSTIVGLDEQAVHAVLDDVGDAGAVADHGPRPRQTASSAHAAALPSATAGTRTRRVHRRPRPARRETLGDHSVCAGRSRDQLFDDGAQRPVADEVQSRLGHARCRKPPRVDERVEVLVALEHADEDGARPRRQRRGRRSRNASASTYDGKTRRPARRRAPRTRPVVCSRRCGSRPRRARERREPSAPG